MGRFEAALQCFFQVVWCDSLHKFASKISMWFVGCKSVHNFSGCASLGVAVELYFQDAAPWPCRPNLQTVVLLKVPQCKEEKLSWNELLLAISCEFYAMISRKTSFPGYFMLGVCVVFFSFLRHFEKL